MEEDSDNVDSSHGDEGATGSRPPLSQYDGQMTLPHPHPSTPQRSSSLWHSMKRLFHRKSTDKDPGPAGSPGDAGGPGTPGGTSGGTGGKKKKWQSASQLPEKEGTPRKGFLKRRIHGKWSQSHDTLSAGAAPTSSGAGASALSESTTSLQEPPRRAGLLAILRPGSREGGGRQASSEEDSSDAGLPGSPRTLLPDLPSTSAGGEPWHRRYKRRASGAGVGSSTGSEQSLVSLNSSNDSARVSMMSSTDSLYKENDGVGREPMRLRHDAALHKRAVRPRARMSPSKAHRRFLAEQWSSGRFSQLPTTPEVNEDSLLSSQENLPIRQLPSPIPEQLSPVPEKMRRTNDSMDHDSTWQQMGDPPGPPAPRSPPPPVPMDCSLQQSTTLSVTSTTGDAEEVITESDPFPSPGPGAVPRTYPHNRPTLPTSQSDMDFGDLDPPAQTVSIPTSPTPLSIYAPQPPFAPPASSPLTFDLVRDEMRRSFGSRRSSNRSQHGSSGSINRVDRVRCTSASTDEARRSPGTSLPEFDPDTMSAERANTLPNSVALLARHHTTLPRRQALTPPAPARPPRGADSNGNLAAEEGAGGQEDVQTVPTVKTMAFDERGFLVLVDKPVETASPAAAAAATQSQEVQDFPAENENDYETIEQHKRHPSSSLDEDSSGSDQPEGGFGFSNVFAKWKQADASAVPSAGSSGRRTAGPPSGVPRMGVVSATYYSARSQNGGPYLQRSHTTSGTSPPSIARKDDTLNGSVDSGVMVLSEEDYHANPSSLSTGNLSSAGSSNASPQTTARSTGVLATLQPGSEAQRGSAGVVSRSPLTQASGEMKRPAWTQRATETRRKHRERTQQALQQQLPQQRTMSASGDASVDFEDNEQEGDSSPGQPRRTSKVLDLINTFQNLQSTL